MQTYLLMMPQARHSLFTTARQEAVVAEARSPDKGRGARTPRIESWMLTQFILLVSVEELTILVR